MARTLPTRASGILHFSWKGQEQLIRNLRMLDDAIPEIVKPALRFGAMLVAEAARGYAEERKDTGTLQASIGVKVWSSPDQMMLQAYIGPRRRRGRMVTGPKAGKSSWNKGNKRHERQGGKQRIPTRYAHFVESGFTLASGRKVEGIHFMKRAIDGTGPRAMRYVAGQIGMGIKKAVARMSKAGAIGR